MRKKILFGISFILFFVFFLIFSSYASSKISKGSPALVANDVGRGQIISGYINFSLANLSGGEDVIIKINSSEVKRMKLMDVIKVAVEKGKDFDCYYNDEKVSCDKVFDVVSSGEVYIGKAGDNYVGFYFDKIDEVDNLSFVINGSSSGEECGKAPLSIDFFADNSVDYLYINPGSSTCGYRYPRNYSESYSSENVLIDENWKCELIKLEHLSGKVKIGGMIKLANTSYTTNKGDLIFRIKTTKDFFCNSTTTSTIYSEVSCDVDVFVKPETYEVCVKASRNAAESKAFHLLKKKAYALFVSEYGNLQLYGVIDFNSSIYHQQTGRNLKDDLDDFIKFKCNGSCIIPLYINSTQPFGLRDLSLEYKSGNDIIILNQFSSLSIDYPEIDSKDYKTIPLEIFNITSPIGYGKYELIIEIAGKEFSDYFFVQQVPIVAGIFPSQALLGEPTTFNVLAYSPKGNSIVEYYVDWGDGQTSQNNNGVFSHTYNNIGNFNVFVRVKDNESLEGAGNFVIYVNVSKEVLNQTLMSTLQKINEIQQRLDPLVLTFLNLNETKQKLNELLMNLSYADLTTIKREFDQLKSSIPVEVRKTTYPSFGYIVNWERIDLGNVEQIIGSCPYSEEACKKGIGIWNKDIGIRISGEKYWLRFYDGNSRIFTYVSLSPSTNKSGYVIIDVSPSSIKSYTQFEDLGNAIAVNLSSFSFAYDGDLSIYNINLYAIPSSFNEISIEEEAGERELYKPGRNYFWILFFVLLILLIVGLIIIWFPYIKNILRQKKKEKERKLFPSLTDYYNLFNFISNALASGQSEKEIYEKLLKAGWKKEQVDYVIKEVKKKTKVKK
jgi:hypothetical protein